jgi:hypothetical protein
MFKKQWQWTVAWKTLKWPLKLNATDRESRRHAGRSTDCKYPCNKLHWHHDLYQPWKVNLLWHFVERFLSSIHRIPDSMCWLLCMSVLCVKLLPSKTLFMSLNMSVVWQYFSSFGSIKRSNGSGAGTNSLIAQPGGMPSLKLPPIR